jgi:hypothetical protein
MSAKFLVSGSPLKVELCQQMVGEHVVQLRHKILHENGLKFFAKFAVTNGLRIT